MIEGKDFELVISINLYPVKGCRGISCREASLSVQGLMHDREFLIVDENNQFMTQRTHSLLALVETELDERYLKLSSPDLPQLKVPLREVDPVVRPTRMVTIWKDSVIADDMGDQPAEWLSYFLNQKVRLVRQGPSYQRPIRSEKIPEPYRGALGRAEVSFADADPLLIITQESLADLNKRLPSALPMNRFRPNLVFGGLPDPYREDFWVRIRIGDNLLCGSSLCVRCIVPTINQITLEKTPEPLKTLATYRRVSEGGVVFGRNFLVEACGKPIRVGDPVEILE